MKGNYHRKLYRPDYFGWRYYCQHARRGRRKFDKQMAREAARRERKAAVKDEVEE